MEPNTWPMAVGVVATWEGQANSSWNGPGKLSRKGGGMCGQIWRSSWAESSVQCCSSSRSSMNMRRSAWGWNKGGREAAAAGGEGCLGGGRGRVGLDGAVLLRTEKIQSDHRKFGPNLSPAREVLPSRATWSITGQLPRERGCLAARCF